MPIHKSRRSHVAKSHSRLSLSKSWNQTKVFPGAVAFVLVAGLGVILLNTSHAATFVTSMEVESGTVAGNATASTDSNASGGSAVKFGASGSGGGTYSCISSDQYGLCQYANVPYITGCPNPYVGQNIWAGGSGYSQTLYSNSPKDWYITTNTNTNFGGVQAYPNVGCHMSGTVDSFNSITSSWNVTIPTDITKVAGWAAYDLWFNNTSDEVMIQVDLTANSFYDCTPVVTATFSGMPWHMCAFGSERVWKPGTDDSHLINRISGSVDILAILKYMENNMTNAQDKLPSNSTWTTDWGSGSFGFEVCDTEGTNQTFRVNNFSWTAN